MDQIEQKEQGEFFKELKDIYSINIKIPPTDDMKKNHNQKFLFYIDLTNTQMCSNALLKLSINNSKERQWLGGFLGEFQFNDAKKESQNIFCYYFNKLIEIDGKINIQNLFRFRLFLQEFISTQKNYQMKFVFHFRQKNDNQKELEDHIVECVYQILDGSSNELNDIICLFNKQEIEQINYCKISSKKIHFNKKQCCDKFDIAFIIKLDEFLKYFKFKQNDLNSIGYKCYQYIQEQVNVVLKEFEKELKRLQKDIQQMLEFPVNLNNEIAKSQNVSQYLESLKNLISEIKSIITGCFEQMAKQFQNVLNNQRQKFIVLLSNIVKENTQFEVYLKLIYKDKSPYEAFKELLQFQFELLESDNEILQKLKKHDFNQDCINATCFRMRLDTKQWFEQFNLYLPQSQAYIKRIIPQNNHINIDKTSVFVLGMTRVGKSTLLNILSNPKNIIINKDNRFDVKEKDDKILISHQNISATFTLQMLEIDNFIFYDTPGLCDTYEINRGINQYNTFNEIKRSSQQIFLLMIDGDELQKKKNDLIDSISLIKLMFEEESDNQCFENLIFPIFTKIRNDSTMEQIRQKWEDETMKDVTDPFVLTILNLIKKSIDEDSYSKIYCAENYSLKQSLESEITTLQIKLSDFLEEDNTEQVTQLLTEIKQKKQKLKQLQQVQEVQEADLEKIIQIKDNIFRKCTNLVKERSNKKQSLKFKFSLNPELKAHLLKLLPHRTNFYQYILNIIKIDFITKMLFDDSITIDDKYKQISILCEQKMEKLSDIPKELITENIINQISELNTFNNIISQYDDQNQDPQVIDFKEFQLQVEKVQHAFNEVVPIITSFSFKDIIKEYKSITSVFLGIIFTISIAIMVPIALAASSIKLFSNNIFVSKQEKEKQEKMNLFNIQKVYYKY